MLKSLFVYLILHKKLQLKMSKNLYKIIKVHNEEINQTEST